MGFSWVNRSSSLAYLLICFSLNILSLKRSSQRTTGALFLISNLSASARISLATALLIIPFFTWTYLKKMLIRSSSVFSMSESMTRPEMPLVSCSWARLAIASALVSEIQTPSSASSPQSSSSLFSSEPPFLLPPFFFSSFSFLGGYKNRGIILCQDEFSRKWIQSSIEGVQIGGRQFKAWGVGEAGDVVDVTVLLGPVLDSCPDPKDVIIK